MTETIFLLLASSVVGVFMVYDARTTLNSVRRKFQQDAYLLQTCATES